MKRLQHFALPIVSYTSLGAVMAGAVKLLGVTTSTGALLGWTVGLPVGFLIISCARGGEHIAKSMGGRPADSTLTAYAREAAEAVGIPPPKAVYEIPASEPNAFAASNLLAGSPTVAVTSGLRSALSASELKAVLAHEMGHLQSHDVVRNMHVAVATAGLGGIYEAGRFLLRVESEKSRGSRESESKDKNEGGRAALGLALMGVGLSTQAAAYLMRLAASRSAELAADAAAARAFGSDVMISALKKIDSVAARRPADLTGKGASTEAQAFAFAMISDGPAKGDGAMTAGTHRTWEKKKGAAGVLAKAGKVLRTHPPLDERVAALEKATAEGKVPAKAAKAGTGSFF